MKLELTEKGKQFAQQNTAQSQPLNWDDWSIAESLPEPPAPKYDVPIGPQLPEPDAWLTNRSSFYQDQYSGGPQGPSPMDLARKPIGADSYDPNKRGIGSKLLDFGDWGASHAVYPVAATADFVANLLPRVEGAIMGAKPEETMFGQMLKPVTDKTQQFKDYVYKGGEEVGNRVMSDLEGHPVAQKAAGVGADLIGMVPQAALALLSGGGSAAGQLAPHMEGAAQTTLAALKSATSSPMFKQSFINSIGTGFDEAKEDGASDMEAIMATTLSSAVNALVESSGGIDTLPQEIRGKDLSTPAKAWHWIKDTALDEGKEGVVQSVVENVVNKAAYGSEQQLNPVDLAKQFGYESLLGGLAGGGQMIAGKAFDHLARANMQQKMEDLMPDVPTPVAPQNAVETDIPEPVQVPEVQQNVEPEQARATTKAPEMIWNDFMQKHKGKPTAEDFASLFESIGNTGVSADEFSAYIDGLEKSGKLKFRNDGSPFVPTGNEVPMEERDYGSVGDRSVNAYSYDNPELHPYFADAAEWLGSDVANSTKGERFWNGETGVDSHWTGVKRNTLPELAELMDDWGMNKEKIGKALDDIIEDNGKENNANAKRVEVLLDDLLTNGWTQLDGNVIPPNEDYIRAKGVDPDSIEREQNGIDNDFWQAEFGEDMPDSPNIAKDIDVPTSDQSVDTNNMVQDSTFRPESGANPSMGAADAGFSPYTHAANEYGTIPPGEKPTRVVDVPVTMDGDTKVSQYARTAMEAQATDDEQVGRIEKLVEQNKMSHEVATDDNALDKAGAEIISSYQEGNDNAYDHFITDAASGRVNKDSIALGTLLYADAVATKDYQRASDVLLYLSDSLTKAGQALQAARLLKKLTPEGRVMFVQKMIRKVNNDIRQKTKHTKSTLIQQTAANKKKLQDTLNGVRNDALRQMNRKRDHGEPVENWLNKIGEQLAKVIEPEAKPVQPDRVSQTIKNDLVRFAQDYIPKKQNSKPKRTYTDTLRDYFANREEYARAWNAAKTKVNEAHKGDMEGPEFGGSTLSFNGVGSDSVMTKAIAEAVAAEELKARNIDIRSYLGDAEAVIDEVSGKMIADTEAKGADAVAIRDAVRRYVNGQIKGDGLENIRSDIQSMIRDAQLKISDVIRYSQGQKNQVSAVIAQMLTHDYGVSQDMAQNAAREIVYEFDNYVAEKSQETLDSMFAPKTKAEKKTRSQIFRELANMGAFDSEEYGRLATEKLFGEAVVIPDDLMTAYYDAVTDEQIEAAEEAIYQSIGEQMPTSIGRAIDQFRYLNMLGNVSTHVKNLTGNAGMMGMKSIKDVIATTAEIATDNVSKAIRGKGIERHKAFINPANKADQSILQTAWADYENAADDVAGIGKYGDAVQNKIDEHRRSWKINNPNSDFARGVDKVLETAEKVPEFNTKMLDVEDKWFSRPNYAVSLAQYMKANNLTEVTAEARAYAVKEAQKATFRDLNAVSAWALKLGTGSKASRLITKAVFPFKGTPANVGVRAVEYSPLGVATSLYKAAQAARSGEFVAANLIDDLSASATGTALLGLGLVLASKGVLRVSGIGDEDEKEQQKYVEGYKDNSVTVDIGGKTQSVPIDFLAPSSAELLVGGAVYEAIASKQLEGADWGIDDYLNALGGVLDPVFETTMLDGLANAMRGLDPSRNSLPKMVGKAAINTIGNYLGSFMSSQVSRIGAALDTKGRERYTDKNKDASWLQNPLQGLDMKNPVKRRGLHERIDAYGRTQEGAWKEDNSLLENLGSALWNAVTPTYSSEVKTTKQDELLHDLYRSEDVKGDYRLFVTEPQKSFKVKGENINLTQDQHEQYEKARGKGVFDLREAMMGLEGFDKVPDNEKAAAFDKALTYADQKAKAGLGVGYEAEAWVTKMDGKTDQEVARSIMDSVLLTNKQNELEAQGVSGGRKYRAMADLLMDGLLTEEAVRANSPDGFNEAYDNHAKAKGVSLETWTDAYGMYPDIVDEVKEQYPNMKAADAKETAVNRLLDDLDLPQNQEMGLLDGLYEAYPLRRPYAETPGADLVARRGGSDAEILSKMTPTQQNNYKYYLGNFSKDVPAAEYQQLAARKEELGNQEEFVAELKNSKYPTSIQRKIFCAVGYKESSLGNFW